MWLPFISGEQNIALFLDLLFLKTRRLKSVSQFTGKFFKYIAISNIALLGPLKTAPYWRKKIISKPQSVNKVSELMSLYVDNIAVKEKKRVKKFSNKWKTLVSYLFAKHCLDINLVSSKAKKDLMSEFFFLFKNFDKIRFAEYPT